MDVPQIKTADDVRHLITEQFTQFAPQIKAYGDYAQRMAALCQEYHTLRLAETFPSVPVEELTLAVQLDVRETPKKLDVILAQLFEQEITVKKIIFDHAKFSFFLYV